MHIDTKLTHGGRASAGQLNAVNPPLVRASTTVFDTLAQFKQSYEGLIFEAPRYGRSGTATSFELQSTMAQIENVESCIATASGAAGPFTLELQACSEAGFERFIDGLQLFGLGTSWGGYESLVMPAIPHHLRAMKVLPDEGRLVRLHIGLENVADLQADLAQALGRI